MPGLRLEGSLQQQDSAPTSDEQEEQPQRLLQRPLNYLSTMLTYMAQVHSVLSRLVCVVPAPSHSSDTEGMSKFFYLRLSSRSRGSHASYGVATMRVFRIDRLDQSFSCFQMCCFSIHLPVRTECLRRAAQCMSRSYRSLTPPTPEQRSLVWPHSQAADGCVSSGHAMQNPFVLPPSQVGDAVAEADPAPSEAQNYFAMLQETPRMLLPRLVAQWGCSDSTAERVAALLGLDLVSKLSYCCVRERWLAPLDHSAQPRMPVKCCKACLGEQASNGASNALVSVLHVYWAPSY